MSEEYFQRIEQLREENSKLSSQIQAIDKEITSKKNSHLILQWNSERQITKDKETTTKLQSQISSLFTSLSSTSEQQTIKHTFHVIPLDTSFTQIFISGDFNNWTMSEMTKESELNYTYTTTLLTGYEYAYCFYSCGTKFLNFEEAIIEIPQKNNEEYNIVSFPHKNTSLPITKLYEVTTQNENLNVNNTLLNNKFIITNENEFMSSLFKLNSIIDDRIYNIDTDHQRVLSTHTKKYKEQDDILNKDFQKISTTFQKNYIDRIIIYNSVQYIIKSINPKENVLNCVRLYDPNKLKVNISIQLKLKLYSKIPIGSLFDTAYILSKQESDIIISEYNNDNKNYITIHYSLQDFGYEKEITPRKVEPEVIDLNEYNISTSDTSITSVQHKLTQCFVAFEQRFIGNIKSSSLGLVPTSEIKVYTTFYNKDVLNILHIHMDDTSQEIAIDSEFLEKNEKIANHKLFTTDGSGKRLNYKLLFQNNKLVKIFYSLSNDYIDEPPFKEIRFTPNCMVKINKGEFKHFIGKITQFPLGMLARKDKGDNPLEPMKSFGYEKEGKCGDRHLEELPGFVSLEVEFQPDLDNKGEVIMLEEPITLSIPICHLIPLTFKEQNELEKIRIIHQEKQQNEKDEEVNNAYMLFKKYEEYLNNEKLLDTFTLDELNHIMENVNKDYESLIENDNNDDDGVNVNVDKIEFIKNIQRRFSGVLIRVIRMKALNKGK